MVSAKSYRDHAIVCGYGLVGEKIVEVLTQHGIKVVVIEADSKKAEMAQDFGAKVVVGDATSSKILKQAGIEKARAIAIVMDDDAKNLFCVIAAKSMNRKIVIATRANDELIKDRFLDAGASFIAAPNKSTSDELFREIMKSV